MVIAIDSELTGQRVRCGRFILATNVLDSAVLSAFRQALAQPDQTIPNQLGKPTSSPTLRWVFQCFMAVHLVVFQGVQQVVNLTDDRLHILQFFSQACRRYYLLPAPNS
jgi:hypothetical protein